MEEEWWIFKSEKEFDDFLEWDALMDEELEIEEENGKGNTNTNR